jgi:hypothetical protein
MEIHTSDLVELIGFAAARLMEYAVRVLRNAVITSGHRKEVDAILLSILVGTEPGSYQIAFAIVVPERTRVIPACCCDDSLTGDHEPSGRLAEVI